VTARRSTSVASAAPTATPRQGCHGTAATVTKTSSKSNKEGCRSCRVWARPCRHLQKDSTGQGVQFTSSAVTPTTYTLISTIHHAYHHRCAHTRHLPPCTSRGIISGLTPYYVDHRHVILSHCIAHVSEPTSNTFSRLTARLYPSRPSHIHNLTASSLDHSLDSFRNETFAQRAVELISTFFLDEKTKMNPNFRCVRTALPLFPLSHYHHQSITHFGCERASSSEHSHNPSSHWPTS